MNGESLVKAKNSVETRVLISHQRELCSNMPIRPGQTGNPPKNFGMCAMIKNSISRRIVVWHRCLHRHRRHRRCRHRRCRHRRCRHRRCHRHHRLHCRRHRHERHQRRQHRYHVRARCKASAASITIIVSNSATIFGISTRCPRAWHCHPRHHPRHHH